MSDSESAQRPIGFSTGALERGDFRAGLSWLRDHRIRAVELSALRFGELEPLVTALDSLGFDDDDSGFDYISLHAPSSFPPEQEETVLALLRPVIDRGWNIVVHPDVIHDPDRWRPLGEKLLLENMDRRKPLGRTARELEECFSRLPEARFCLDLAHARDMDPTLALLANLVDRFRDRLAEIHISELDSSCHHVPLSNWAMMDFRRFAHRFPPGVPVIIESMMDGALRDFRLEELQMAEKAVTSAEPRPLDPIPKLATAATE